MDNQVWGVGIANAIKDTISTMQPNILQIGTITSVNPVAVKLNSGLVIPKDFLYISQDLMEYKRKTSFKIEQDKVTATTTIGSAYVDEHGSHSHSATTTITQTGGIEQKPEITFNTIIKNGDKVLLANIDNGQVYIIINVLKKL